MDDEFDDHGIAAAFDDDDDDDDGDFVDELGTRQPYVQVLRSPEAPLKVREVFEDEAGLGFDEDLEEDDDEVDRSML